ncbi:MAG: potassium transporter TrkG [Fuerstiella sp.]
MLDNLHQDSALHQQIAANRTQKLSQRLMVSEVFVTIVGFMALLTHAGFINVGEARVLEFDAIVVLAMSWLSISRGIRLVMNWSNRSVLDQFLSGRLLVPIVWLLGLLLIYLTGFTQLASQSSRVLWSDLMIGVAGVLAVLYGCRALAARTQNSAVLLVGSFAVVITLGTLLLKLPACRAPNANGELETAPWNVALFTATSASCVTGLIVEPTGSYWSPLGHAVIFGLFQIGGLGILTFGAFVAVLSGRRGLQFKEARTLRNMLDSESMQDSRRLLFTILLFTVGVETIGAISLLGLHPELPLPQRIWDATFHSVSAFCNAGFSLQDDGFLNLGTRWQIWGPLSLLIVLGGLGFSVVSDTARWMTQTLSRRSRRPLFHFAKKKARLSLHSRIVLWSTLLLLVFGATLWFALESIHAEAGSSVTKRVADSWFQSVTFRTAGFNSVDHEKMHPASKLLAIFLMFIGAAPGSTGGGVKTVVFSVTVLNVWSVFRGRDRVELFGRCIPASQVSRSLSMIAVGLFIVMATTGLLVIFEQKPERFLDHLFEATSAFGTVGVSAGITAGLTLPSRLLICVVMFLGRVGPITLLLAMAASNDCGRYDYPEERVSLG